MVDAKETKRSFDKLRMSGVIVSQGIRQSLLAHAARAYPNECCGILLGTANHITAVIPAENVDPSPAIRFEINPQTLIDAHRAARGGGSAVLGYYHSHPDGNPVPSGTDQDMAAGDGAIWAIVAGNAIGWWRDAPGGFEALPSPFPPL